MLSVLASGGFLPALSLFRPSPGKMFAFGIAISLPVASLLAIARPCWFRRWWLLASAWSVAGGAPGDRHVVLLCPVVVGGQVVPSLLVMSSEALSKMALSWLNGFDVINGLWRSKLQSARWKFSSFSRTSIDFVDNALSSFLLILPWWLRLVLVFAWFFNVSGGSFRSSAYRWCWSVAPASSAQVFYDVV